MLIITTLGPLSTVHTQGVTARLSRLRLGQGWTLEDGSCSLQPGQCRLCPGPPQPMCLVTKVAPGAAGVGPRHSPPGSALHCHCDMPHVSGGGEALSIHHPHPSAGHKHVKNTALPWLQQDTDHTTLYWCGGGQPGTL